MAAVDTYGGHEPGLISPIRGGAAVTPHDTTELAYVTRSLYIGTSGHLKVTTVDGSVLTYFNVPVGRISIRAKIVWSSVTTAAQIVAEW